MKLSRHTWVNWFVSPICHVDVPSALPGPIVCWYRPWVTVYRRRPGLPGRRTNHLEQPAGQRDLCPSLSTSRQRLKHFCFRPRSLTLSLIPVKLFPTSSGSWSDFVTWTTLKIHDWLIDGSRPSGASSITCRLNSLLQDYLVLLVSRQVFTFICNSRTRGHLFKLFCRI